MTGAPPRHPHAGPDYPQAVPLGALEEHRVPRLLVATRFGLGVHDPAWLEHRLELIGAITAPSLANQTNQAFTWVILTDPSLPAELRARLEALTATLESAHVVDGTRFPFASHGFVALTAQLDTRSSGDWILTGRLDDDDAWHRETVDRVYDEAMTWQDGASSAGGVGITFSHMLEWVMYDMVSLPRSSGKPLRTAPALVRSVHEPFASMSVFVLARAATGMSARSAGHNHMAEHLRERSYDIRVVETDEPACLYCRHKQINTAVGKGNRDAPRREPDIAQLTRLFGIDDARTRRYLERADEIPYALEKYPNHRRRERAGALEEIERELAGADDQLRRAELRARRRLLKAEAERTDAGRVSTFEELLDLRDPSAGRVSAAEQIAELRGILAERRRAEAETQRILTESELAVVRAEAKPSPHGLRKWVARKLYRITSERDAATAQPGQRPTIEDVSPCSAPERADAMSVPEQDPRLRPRERVAALEEIERELAEADDERRQAELRARRRLLKAEARRAGGSRVDACDEPVDASVGQGNRAEKAAERRGILAERRRAEVETERLLTESELSAVRAAAKADKLRRRLDQQREHAARRASKLERLRAREDAFTDIARRLPNAPMRRIFDVGANVGQTVAQIRASFPEAEIWAFEPVPETFAALRDRFGDQTHCFQMALGARSGVGQSTARGTSSMNRLVNLDNRSTGTPTVEVEVETGDEFCSAHSIETIDYLKIDTEGHDLDVLRGFSGLLEKPSITFVQVEAGMNSDNERHVPFRDFEEFFAPLDYRLLGLYQQVAQGKRGPHLRRVNAVYVSRPAVELARADDS